jgi:hypothetical protein
MSVLARNRHPTGRGGKMLEETLRAYSYFAPVCGNNICILSRRSLPQSELWRVDDDPCSICFGSSFNVY